MKPVDDSRPIRVLVVDDHEVVRQGVRMLLERAGGIVVCGEASGTTDAVEVAEDKQPDVVAMDVRLAQGSGIEATRAIRSRCPDTVVIMLTSFPDEEAIFSSIMVGAAGYVLKDIKGFDLVQAVRTVARGHSLLDPAITHSVLNRLRKSDKLLADERLSRLSAKEEQILSLVADGKTNKQIADKLYFAEKTVSNYVSSILAKLDVSRRAEAAAYHARYAR